MPKIYSKLKEAIVEMRIIFRKHGNNFVMSGCLKQKRRISELTSFSIFSIYESQETKIKNHLIN